jgi:SAM-dependent methyltransferase
MDKQYALKYHGLEESHWWFLGRRDIIYRLIKEHRKDAEILDIGCSGCALLFFLRGKGFKKLQGIDINEDAIDLCRQKGISNVQIANAEKTGFADQRFNILIASDILEHVKDENKALSEWHRVLKKDGILIIFVPAFQFLWSPHDEVNLHYRRYVQSGLIEILQKNGFAVERSSYWNSILYLPVSLLILFRKYLVGDTGRSGDNLRKTSPFVNKLLECLLKVENIALSVGMNFAFGMSVFAIARRV